MTTILVILFLPIVFVDSIVMKSFYFLLLSICYGFMSYKKNRAIHDPRVLFIPILAIYSSFYPLQQMIVPNQILPIDMEILNYSLNLSLIFTFTVAFVFELTSKPKYTYNIRYETIRSSDKLFLLIILAISITLFILIYFRAASNKQDLYSFANSLQLFTLFFGTFLLTRLLASRATKLISMPTILIFILSVFSMLIQGERDVIFRFLLLTVIIFFSFRKNPKISIYFMLIGVMILVVPISQIFKGILNYNTFTGLSFDAELIANLLLSNEFISAGRNLYATILYSAPGENSWFFFTDIVRGLFPIGIFGGEIVSSTNWYNSEFREINGFSGSAGWGFSIIAQGYIIGGIWGVIIMAILIALSLGSLFNMSFKSLNHYVFYLFFLSASIYAVRADLATVLSLGVKLPLACMIIIYFFRQFFPKVSNS
tara:strand:- start:511 stop:1791 length:1281 start_codon:yes stop_codon:yes gene_type:complete